MPEGQHRLSLQAERSKTQFFNGPTKGRFSPDIMVWRTQTQLWPPLRSAMPFDRAVDRLYRRTGFASEREKAEHLFTLYEKKKTPLETLTRGGHRKGRRR